MNAGIPIDPTNAGVGPADGGTGSGGSRLTLEIQHVEPGDASQFRAALDRHMSAANAPVPGGADGRNPSLGEKLAGRATSLASEIKQDQQHVSKMLEQASRTGDSMQLMRAMMALSDYQIRVQTISKTVAKTATAFEQLTKLQ